MRRREVIAGFVGALFAPSPAALAQTGSKVPVVGVAALATRESHALDLEGLRQGLRERGYQEGRTIRIEERYADGDRTRFAEFAAELVRDGTEVFVTPGPRAAQMIQAVAPKVPVVAVALPASYPALFESLAKSLSGRCAPPWLGAIPACRSGRRPPRSLGGRPVRRLARSLPACSPPRRKAIVTLQVRSRHCHACSLLARGDKEWYLSAARAGL